MKPTDRASNMSIRQFYRGMVAGAVLQKCVAFEVKTGIPMDFASELEKAVDAMMNADKEVINVTEALK